MTQRWSDGASADPKDWLYIMSRRFHLHSFAFFSFQHLVHDQVELELKEEERWPHS